MKFASLDISDIADWPADAALTGACVVVPGVLRAQPELTELPAAIKPAAILCKACDAWLARLLNQRGVVVAHPKDPVGGIRNGTEVEADFSNGVLTELDSGRRFALQPVPPEHLKEIRAHA
jgi:hypothetical protein